MVDARRSGASPTPSLLLLTPFLLAARLAARLIRLLAKILTLLHILDDILELSRKVVTLHVGKNCCVVLFVCEVKVVCIRYLSYNAAPLTVLQQIYVPLAQTIVLGCLLVFWLGTEDVVIPLERRTSPDVSSIVPLATHVVKVRNEQLVVNVSTHLAGPHVVDTIEIRDVYGTFVRSGIRLVMLVNVQSK